MTTSPVTCIRDPEIDPTRLGALLIALASSDKTALKETNYFDESWTADVPNVPKALDPSDDPDDPVMGRNTGRGTFKYHRVVAVQDGEYVGFLAGRFDKSAFVAIAAALHPRRGVGPKLLDTFSEMAIAAGRTQLLLKPDRGDRHDDRVRFFKRYGFDWYEGSTIRMCKPLVEAETASMN
ncbi:GNAT family N-acetyltransferase [Prescottella equi]